MNGQQRRNAIVDVLETSAIPVSGAALGALFGVSRQIIVQDIAILRSSGLSVQSTNRGYVLDSPTTAQSVLRMIKVRHTPEQIEQELNAIVDLGGTVVDTVVNHRTYGLLSATIDISSRRDVAHFVEELNAGISEPLSSITKGYHFHHIKADSEEILDEIVEALDELGFLAPFTPYEETILA